MASVTTRHRILRAAGRVLAEQGAVALTTRRVAEAAGVQPPALYRLFGEKDGLIEALAADAFERFLAEAERTDAPADPVAALRAGWHESLRFAHLNPDLYRLLQSLTGPTSRSRTGRAFEALRARVAAVEDVGLLAVAQDVAVDLLYAAGHGVIQTGLDHPDRLDPRLGDLMLQAVLTQILVPSEPAASATSTAAAGLLHALAGEDATPLTPAETALLRDWLGRVVRGDGDPSQRPPSTAITSLDG